MNAASTAPAEVPTPRGRCFEPSAYDPRLLSGLLARAQAHVRATRGPLTANVLAGLIAQEPALAGATVERETNGEMVIDLAGGQAWATLDGAGRLEWVTADVPDPETPPHDSVAFAKGRQQFRAVVALLARSKRRLLDGPVRCKGARPRAVRFKPRSGARRAARRGATRAGPGEDGGSEREPTGALFRPVGVAARMCPSPGWQNVRRSPARWGLPRRLSGALPREATVRQSPPGVQS